MLIIDTDIGDDIDDAFAISWAIASPAVEVCAVVTTFGDTTLRARLARRLLDLNGRADVLVATGIATPPGAIFTQAEWARTGPDIKFPDGITLTLDLIRRHPGRITLVALGPLGNVREMIRRDPNTFRKLDKIVMMGGSIRRGYNDAIGKQNSEPHAEHNVAHDIAGFRAMLESGVSITLMPLDSTQAIPCPALLDRVFEVRPELAELTAQWAAHNSWGHTLPTLYDVAAMAATISPILCPLVSLCLSVNNTGLTIEESGSPNIRACLTSNEEEILSLMADDLIGGKGKTHKSS